MLTIAVAAATDAATVARRRHDRRRVGADRCDHPPLEARRRLGLGRQEWEHVGGLGELGDVRLARAALAHVLEGLGPLGAAHDAHRELGREVAHFGAGERAHRCSQ